MSYRDNLNKAISIVERNAEYIKQLKASGFELPDYYESIPQKLNTIKNDPNRTGISAAKLKKVQYLFNKNVMKSRASFDTTMVINRLGPTEILPKKLRLSKPKDFQEYSDKLNNMISDYINQIDANHYPNSLPTIQATALKNDISMLGQSLGDIDFTELANIGPGSMNYRALLNRVEMVFTNAPAPLSPFKDEIYKKIGEESHVKFLTGAGFSNDDIAKFEQYIDSSQFWNLIHKSHYSSSQETGKHEIRDVVGRLRTAMFDVPGDRADFDKLHDLIRNSNNYKAIDNFVKKRLSKLYKAGRL